jgi:hypothetical protein
MGFYNVPVNRSVPTEANRGLTSYINSFTWLPVTAQAGFSQLIGGGELMLHKNALLAARTSELEEQLAVMTKRKMRKRKRIQHGGTMEYGEAAEASIAAGRSKKARGSGDQERAQPPVQRCGNCGGTRRANVQKKCRDIF